MKTLRKTLSIVLTVTVLMTVFAGMFVNTANAYTYADNNLLVLDFDDGKGIANWTAAETWSTKDTVAEELRGTQKWGAEFTTDPVNPDNGVFYMWNTAYNSFSAQIGTPDATGVSDDDAFCMEAGKTYTLTFKYKYAANSGSAFDDNGTIKNRNLITMYKGSQIAYTADTVTGKAPLGNVASHDLSSDDANVKEMGTYDAVKTELGSYTRLALMNDTAWQVATYNITGDSDKNNIFFTISAGNNAVIGNDGHHPSFIGLYIDDVVIAETSGANATEVSEANTYVYDFKDAAGNVMPLSMFGADHNSSNAGRHAWFSNSHSASGKSYMTEEGAVLYATTGLPTLYPNLSTAFIHKICLKDPDFQISNSATSVKGFLSLEAGNIYTITAKVKPYGNSNPEKVVVGIGLSENAGGGTSSAFGTLNLATVDNNGWTYVSATVDGDGKWQMQTNQSPITEDNAGRIPCIYTANSATILIESVTVTVAKKSSYYSQKTYELNKAAACHAGSASNLYSDAFRTVLNASTTNDITVVPSSTGNQRIPFTTGNYSYNPNAYNYINNIILEEGKTYRLELEYAYDATAEGAKGVVVGWMRTTNRTTNTWEVGHNLANQINAAGTKSDSVYLDYTFTADAEAAGNYLLLRLSRYGDGPDLSTVTIKNAKVTVIDSNDSTNVGFTEAAKRSIRAESNDGTYVSAGLRFRGTLTTAQYENAAEVGFAVIPSSLINNDYEKWFAIDAEGNLANANAKRVDCTNKIYADNGTTRDYQLILTNLTKEDSAKNLKDTEFSVVMYTKDASGNYSYYFVNESSYNDVKAAYVEKDAANAEIY